MAAQSQKFYVYHSLDGRVVKVDSKNLSIELGFFKSPSYFDSEAKAQQLIYSLSSFFDCEDADYLNVGKV